MDVIVMGGNVSRSILDMSDPTRLTPRRALEALGFMAQSQWRFFKLRPEVRQGYNYPSFTDAEREHLVKSLPPQLILYDSRPETLEETDCEKCKHDGEEVPDEIYRLSLNCGHWFHAHCFVATLTKMEKGKDQCPVEKCPERIDTEPAASEARDWWRREGRSYRGGLLGP
ncbi:hypothetical protein O9K51_10681 [Purpureocillium lavendulum]|uniref:RING-type domain-containing protein n=1 Tax=Purpureocillium lavendulum TaxID=1247861 RepID=A0AB34FCJ3_9HYPO|nr:hypothetical protein O9K51_10681 [Purpureocillium lavendulum]